METINFYNYQLHISHCNDVEIYHNDAINSTIDTLLSKSHAHYDESQIGDALSTVGLNFDMSGLPEFYNFYSWLVSQISLIRNTYNYKNGRIKFTRTWINQMFEGCEGACHTHPNDVDGVTIFYTRAPENSSDLILVNDSDTLNVPVKPGMLVIHKPDVPHAISKHMSTLPRECIITEFKIIPEIL